jgi:hypothetical protein
MTVDDFPVFFSNDRHIFNSSTQKPQAMGTDTRNKESTYKNELALVQNNQPPAYILNTRLKRAPKCNHQEVSYTNVRPPDRPGPKPTYSYSLAQTVTAAPRH